MTKSLLSITILALVAIVPSAVAQTTYKVAATYWKRSCGMPGMVAESTPVKVGKLEVRRGSGPPVTVDLGEDPVPVMLTGSGILTAKLILETDRVKVVSGAASSAAIAVDLGPPSARLGYETFSVPGNANDHNGSVEALITLERSAKFVQKANGDKALPLLTARVFGGPSGVPDATQFDAPAAINVIAVAGGDDRWEPTPLIHEYGHFVMQSLAPGGTSGGAHLTEESYPLMPDLAWTEGFASAFAAVVMKPEWEGRLLKQCGPYMSLVMPTRPVLAPKHARYAQYNETRVAAATYHLIQYLGGGDAGLGKLLKAMKVYERGGHRAWTTRDLRDLAVQEFETSAADHAAIDDIFGMQGMKWEQSFGLEVDGSEDYGKWADIEIVLSVTGPGGFACRTPSDIYETKPPSKLDGGRGVVSGTKVATGGLSNSVNDDCYLISGDGVVGKPRPKARTIGIDQVQIPFPYLGGLGHWAGDYTVRAKYVCEKDAGPGSFPGFRCPSKFTVQLRIWNSWLIFNEPNLREPIPVTLDKDTDTLILTFKANGECKTAGGVDCGF